MAKKSWVRFLLTTNLFFKALVNLKLFGVHATIVKKIENLILGKPEEKLIGSLLRSNPSRGKNLFVTTWADLKIVGPIFDQKCFRSGNLDIDWGEI